MDIKCIIIDDEVNNIENLQGILSKWCPGVTVVASADNADDGIKAIDAHKPDLIFLDIQMPEKTGFDMLKALGAINFEVIFITAFDQYGIQAIKFSALDYLLKPVDVADVQQAVEKARARIATRKQNLSVENLLEFMRRAQTAEAPKIALPTMQETRYVKVDDIIRCEAADNYSTVFINDGDSMLVCKTLKEFTELLKTFGFQRPHQSHLVNFRFVKSFLKEDNGTLLLHDKSKIPISRQNLDAIKKALNSMV
ncbi:MAG: LytTR family DNA-binding domain-containing protein [Bacteroidota bacterium]